MAAALVFHGLGGQLGVWPWAALVGLLALSADCAVNYTLVALATSLMSKRPARSVLGEMSLGSAVTFVLAYVCFGFLGVFLAETYARLGFLGVAGFVAPIILARQGFVHWRRLDEAQESIQAKNDALRSVDERIADERRDERARIAAALHDDVLQCLYNVTIRTQIIKEDLRWGRLLDLDDDVPALLQASEEAVEELRDVIGDLRRSTIGHAGLVDTLTLLVEHLRTESGIHFVADLDATVRARAEHRARCLSGGSGSPNEHPQALWRQDRLGLPSCVDGWVVLAVEDDGRGFDIRGGDKSKTRRHFGLQLMRERAASCGGSFDLQSSPGAGTTINLRVPLRVRP